MAGHEVARVCLHPLVGLELSGASLTPFDDLDPGSGALGRPVWGPEQLLRDLELRLGIDAAASSDALRTARWAARMDRLAERDRFYSASFTVDPLGTARAVLELRDALLEAGWDGRAIPNGGPRLEAIAELEALDSPALPPGHVDRVVAIARALEDFPVRLYEQLTLAEASESWSLCWNRVFERLQRTGTELTELSRFAMPLPGAPPESDLGKVQAALTSDRLANSSSGATRGGASLQGDGSLLLLTAETSLEAARATAAVLSREDAASSVVIREGDESALDHALWLQGLPTQGLHSASPWRAALQILPLALELAFEPKDPYRVLELLSLPHGPFTGGVSRLLVRALARSPGIGGRAWEDAKARSSEPREEVLQRIAEWFETHGSDPIAGATKQELLRVLERVRTWLGSRIPFNPEDVTLYAAVQHCDALAEALEADSRERFGLVAVRRLVEFVMSSGTRLGLTPERAGRIAHVASASALWVQRQTVLWWSFTHGHEPPANSPWRHRELAALEHAGVRFPKPERRWLERASGYRRATCSATQRLILVAPRMVTGQAVPTHPLWDEIVARLELDEATRARLTRSAADLLSGDPCSVPRASVEPLSLPASHAEWRIELGSPPEFSHYSASSLSALLGCPLQWAFTTLAGLDSEGTGLPASHRLSGDLGHRLIEELYAQGALESSLEELRASAEREIDGLFEREGAPLLRPGKAHERDQLRRQLVDAACALARALDEDGLSVDGVEQAFEVPWREAELKGRWDLLVRDAAGRRFVIDVKWGQADYKKMLETGSALQLATYTHALAATEPSSTEPVNTAAYFSLSTRSLFGHAAPGLEQIQAVSGPSLSQIWQRVERTLPLVEQQLVQGRFAATGLSRSLPLLEQLEIPEHDHPQHFSVEPERACKHCRFDGLCGQRWEGCS